MKQFPISHDYLIARVEKCSNNDYNHLIGEQVTLSNFFGFMSREGFGQVGCDQNGSTVMILDKDCTILMLAKKNDKRKSSSNT